METEPLTTTDKASIAAVVMLLIAAFTVEAMVFGPLWQKILWIGWVGTTIAVGFGIYMRETNNV